MNPADTKSNWHASLTPGEAAELEEIRAGVKRLEDERARLTYRRRKLYDRARKRAEDSAA